LIRPVVGFGQSAAERAAETGAAERTLYRQIARFDQLGMASFVLPPKVEKHRVRPAEVLHRVCGSLVAPRSSIASSPARASAACWIGQVCAVPAVAGLCWLERLVRERGNWTRPPTAARSGYVRR
jgi:hypothetical protein